VHLSLRGYATALLEEVVREPVGRRITDDLTAVAHLVSRTSDLAVVLTDFTVPTPARKAVLEDLLSSRIDPSALRLALVAVETERADELPTSLHELYELVLHMHELGTEQQRAEEPIWTGTGWKNFASGYTSAVLEDVGTPELEEVEDEIFRFARIVESHPALRSALSDPTRAPTDRTALVERLIGQKVRPPTLRIVTLPLKGRVRDIVGSLDWLAEQVAQARGWRVARVSTARPLDAEERDALTRELQQITGRPVELQILEDPALLGGAVVQVGDLLVDASTRHRLETLGDRLLGRDREATGAAR
jgi:F-type H+-transporting ATPase subunit delta